MRTIRVANAPCSWGTLEFESAAGEQIGYQQMLDELRETGYEGTELGDWGYMPTDPDALRQALASCAVSLRGAFVPVDLSHESEHAAGIRQAVRTAKLLAAAGDKSDPPVLVLSDKNGADPVRATHAGRISPEMGLARAAWELVAAGATRIARAVREEAGIQTVFHHHCAGFVETPGEVVRLMEQTDPSDLGLVFDTGHYAFGAGSCEAVMEGLERWRDRITYVHFKDCSPAVMAQASKECWDYLEAVQHGIFCELGLGGVDFSGVLEHLRATDYEGWIVVEQDVLPGMGTPKASAQRNRDYLRSLGL